MGNLPTSGDARSERARDRRPASSSSSKVVAAAELGNALELLRVVATVLVLFYHAALAYVATPLRLTLWVAYEPKGHVAFDVLVYWVNGFVMPFFFLAAGVSAPAAYESRGPRAFLEHRSRRLLRPLLFAGLTILPISYLLWGYGLMATGRCDLDAILSWKFDGSVRSNLYGLGHLWFLEYLFVVCVMWCLGTWLRRRLLGATGRSAAAPDWLSRWWAPLALSVPTALIFLFDSDTMLRVDNVVVPSVTRLLHYWLFFEVGGWLSKVEYVGPRLARSGPYLLGSAFAVYGLMLPLLLRHAAFPLHGTERIIYCGLAAVFPWLTVMGALGVVLRSGPAKGPLVRTLSEASFWVYLIHIPIVSFFQLAFLGRAWPLGIKFTLVAALTLGLSLWSYGPCVRYSLIGAIINGTRKRAPKGLRFGPEFGWVAVATVAMLLCLWGGWSARRFVFGHNYYAEVPGRIYRSARLSPAELDLLIGHEKFRSVVVFTGNASRHSWFQGQLRVCRARDVELHDFALGSSAAPDRPTLLRLVSLLERCPRPVLVEGYRGTDQIALAAGLLRLIEGSPPAVALREFDLNYGQFSGAEHSALGKVLLDYQAWLAYRHEPHTFDHLREWVCEFYGAPGLPIPSRPPVEIARKTRLSKPL